MDIGWTAKLRSVADPANIMFLTKKTAMGAQASTRQIMVFQNLRPKRRPFSLKKTIIDNAGMKANPIYLANIANPRHSDDAISKDNVGLWIYRQRRMTQARESVMKRGSDNAVACNSMNSADDKKKTMAKVVVKKLRPAIKYTANAISPMFMPKSRAFSIRAA